MDQNSVARTAELNLDTFLEEVRSLLQRQRVVEGLISRQSGPNQDLLESLTYRQHFTEMQNHLVTHHPADIAFVLESLPIEDRQRIWNQVWKLRGGTILLELSENVRKGLIDSLSRDDRSRKRRKDLMSSIKAVTKTRTPPMKNENPTLAKSME